MRRSSRSKDLLLKIGVIIPAGGHGRRFGGRKQFQSLHGKPVLVRTLEKFVEVAGEIVVVVPTDDIPLAQKLVRPLSAKIRLVAGGRERQDSVYAGLKALSPCDIVVVHDAVRPLVSREVIQKVIEAAEREGAAAAGVRVKETTKRVDTGGWVVETISRDALWSIQTPQAFRTSLIKESFEGALRDRFVGTDEAMLVERLGQPVKVVEGEPMNIKITTPEDLKLAEVLLDR